MFTLLNLLYILWSQQTAGSVVGLSYLDDQMSRRSQPMSRDNPCNSLYWYPRPIPEQCYVSTPAPRHGAAVVPATVQMPVPLQPLPIPVISPIPMIPPMSLPPTAIQPITSINSDPPEPLPFGVPMIPALPMSILRISYPSSMPYRNPYSNLGTGQIGFVPGLKGLVAPGGGINILPFSDAYSDMFERFKQKAITRELKKKLGNNTRYPW